jgi:hypothetical protein
MAVVWFNRPASKIPPEVNLASRVAEWSGLAMSDGWFVVFAANWWNSRKPELLI